MDDKKLIIKNNIDIAEYSAAVQNIAKMFFDEDGTYTPHFGRANAIGVFFNYFVDGDSLLDYFSEEQKKLDLNFLLENEECLSFYNNALTSAGYYRLDFANAYADAMEIVRAKNHSFAGLFEGFKSILGSILEKAGDLLTEDKINKLAEISNEITNGNISKDSIFEAYNALIKMDKKE